MARLDTERSDLSLLNLSQPLAYEPDAACVAAVCMRRDSASRNEVDADGRHGIQPAHEACPGFAVPFAR